MQVKLERQEEPYPSNCTKSWTQTNFTDLMNDPVDENEFNDDALDYNMAVYKVFCYYSSNTNQRRGKMIRMKLLLSLLLLFLLLLL